MGLNVSRCGVVKDRYQARIPRTFSVMLLDDSNTRGKPYKGVRKTKE